MSDCCGAFSLFIAFKWQITCTFHAHFIEFATALWVRLAKVQDAPVSFHSHERHRHAQGEILNSGVNITLCDPSDRMAASPGYSLCLSQLYPTHVTLMEKKLTDKWMSCRVGSCLSLHSVFNKRTVWHLWLLHHFASILMTKEIN